ncbi:acetoacetate decarboxylase family protein [Actinomadura litoris]|uniref:acetoacetate decarboxylase family protein n=1 Tax=Actinomadura litoris TaxID=2678616 RepID=UPI0035E41046
MPAFAPLYGLGSETASLRWLTVEYRTRPDVLARVLPPPLCPTEEPIAAVWVAEFVSASFHLPDGGVERRPPYMQAGVCVRCRRADEEGGLPAHVLHRWAQPRRARPRARWPAEEAGQVGATGAGRDRRLR